MGVLVLDNLDHNCHNTHARGQGARVPLSGWGEWVMWGGDPGLQGRGKVLVEGDRRSPTI